jgi:hypothetical protein
VRDAHAIHLGHFSLLSRDNLMFFILVASLAVGIIADISGPA